jgi:hypothetical protein
MPEKSIGLFGAGHDARKKDGKCRDCQKRICVACQRNEFCEWCRDVDDWPVIDDLNASEHCRRCWFEMAETRGRQLGDVPQYKGEPR